MLRTVLGRAGLRAVLMAGLVACQSPLSTDEGRRLLENEQRWARRGFANYSIETRSGCFCPSEIQTWTRIEVVDAKVRRATLLETGEVITDARLSYWSTVEELFAELQRAPRSLFLAEVKVTFDPTLGFPSYVEWIPKAGVTDAGGATSMRNAQPLQ